jgi:hypothetical protein
MEISEELLAAMRQMMRQAIAANERAIGFEQAALSIHGSTPQTEEVIDLLSPCEVLVQNLFKEAHVFHGSVPSKSRQAWLEAIERCKGHIPEAEYNAALAILRVGV